MTKITIDEVEYDTEDFTELQAFQLENRLLRSEAPRFNKLQNY